VSRVRSLLIATTLALAALPAAAPTFAQSPSPDTAATPDAIALVRATDPGFVDLPTLRDVQRQVARSFDWTPLLAGSWISLVSTSGAVAADYGDGLGWLDPGVGSVVEVMLVDGCPAELEEIPTEDPCASRESRLYLVGLDGSINPIAEASTAGE
jgi:hypothetical protein